MLDDVVKLLALLVVCVVAISAGIYVLIETRFSGEAHDRNASTLYSWSENIKHSTSLNTISDDIADESCAQFALLDLNRADGGSIDAPLTQMIFVLLNSAVLMSDLSPCIMREAGTTHWFLAWLYSFLFVVGTAILLLNMLIAMMAKTFDEVWDRSEINHQFLFARQYVAHVMRPPEPPPLNIVRSTFVLFNLLLEVLSAITPDWCVWIENVYEFLHRVIRESFEYDTLKALNLARGDDDAHEAEDYVGTTFAGRNSFQAWKAALPVEEMDDQIVEYCSGHESADFVEGRWRSGMLRRMRAHHDEINAQLREQKRQLETLIEMQRNGGGGAAAAAGADSPKNSRFGARNGSWADVLHTAKRGNRRANW